MKPDGVTTAALEPMETLDANPAPEEIPVAGQEPNQAASPVGEEVVPPSTQEESKPSEETPAKANKKPSGDTKSKTPSKTAKTKPGTTPTKSATASKTTPGRISNGVSKPQTNGVPKKTTPASDKKSTPLTKRPTGTTPTPKSAPKPTERKTPTSLTNGAKTATAAAKKTPTSANGVKTSSATAAAKKPAASKPAATTATKPSSAAAPKAPAPKTTRTPLGTSATRPPSSSTTKSSAAAPKPASKPSTASSKPPTSKPTTPSAGKTPASQTSKTTTPVKKDVSKPATSTAKKPTESPYARANPPPKPAKQDTPKSTAKPGTAAKKPTPIKAAESKTPTRPKTETKAPAPKDASKTPKPATAKATSPKKTVGSSTPTPVKRGPKTTEVNKEAAVAAATAAAATAAVAAVIAKPEEQPPVEANFQEPKLSPEPFMEAPVKPKAEPYREPTPEPVREPSPEPEPHEKRATAEGGTELVHDVFEKTTDTSVTSLGTTVLSPPCSPTGPVSPAREVPNAALLDFQADLTNVQDEQKRVENTTQEEEEEEEESKENENMFMVSSTPFAVASSMGKEPQTLSTTSPFDAFGSGGAVSPHEKEEAVEKAEEEINEDDDDEDEEDEEQRRFGLHPSSMITDLSSSQPSEDIQRSSAFGGSMGWHGDDLLSGMDSEDMSSCTSSRQQGVSDLSSTQHTAILEGTQSSDALVDSSLRGSEGDANLTGSPNVETIANEEEDEDEEDERVDDMDLSSERAEEHHKVFSHQEEEDEDVEMHSEGKTESGGNVEEDLNEDEHSLNQSGHQVSHPPTAAWGQSNPFNDSWSQPASLPPASSPSPMSEQGAADSETPTQSPAQPCFDSSAPPTFSAQSEEEVAHHMSPKVSELLSAPARPEGSESSTPEDLREYDSSSGVESRSDKQNTPLPAQPDLEQDLGIHMEKADGEEEEAETLPADEVLGTGPPTAPASAPSSASTSGDEASDTEGEMQINDPDAPMTMGDSPTPGSNLPTFEEDEEVLQAASAEPEEDGGGATPQSANSVGSYGFDCTNSNSNAHSMAESCGKSPGIFSLENEEQLPEEAKDPSLIKELTLPSAAAAADDLLGRPVNLMPLGPGLQSSVEEHHYMMSSKMGAELLHDVDPEEPGHLLDRQDSADSDENQPPYYSTICDKTDNFLEGNV